MLVNASLLYAWRLWDQIYYYSSRLQYVNKNHNVFRVVLLPYWGPELKSNQGMKIEKGDLIVKLHLHNCRLAEIIHHNKNAKALGILLLREVRNSLPGLASFIARHPKSEQIRGVVGTTFLHRGVESLGFSKSPPTMTMTYKIKNYYLRWMLRLMHPDGKERLGRQSEKLTISRVFMTKEELFERYLRND